MERHDVVIVGGGPAGLAVAARLRRKGVRDLVVLEREGEAGGIPRHCGHWGFGWESHRRLLTGPKYASQLRSDADGIDIRTRATVLEFVSPHVMRVHTPDGIAKVEARHVILATGARESSRAARLMGGGRCPGIMNTNTLQQLVYLKNLRPFERPVIVGGEWVSFSALLTCAHAGIRPAAMLVEEDRIEAPWFFRVGSKLRYGVSVWTAARSVAILGGNHVEAVEFDRAGTRHTLPCDGVIVSGRFVPENALFATGPLSAMSDTVADAASFSHVHLVGNVYGSLKTAGRCAAQAYALADTLGAKLS